MPTVTKTGNLLAYMHGVHLVLQTSPILLIFFFQCFEAVFNAEILWHTDPLLGSDHKQTGSRGKQHATTEELLEVVFSVVRDMVVGTQQRSKHVSAAKIELQQ